MRRLAGPGAGEPGGSPAGAQAAALHLLLAAALAIACAAAAVALCARGTGRPRRQRHPEVLQGNGSPVRAARPSRAVADTTGKSLGPDSATHHTGAHATGEYTSSSTLQTAPAESAAIFTLPSTCSIELIAQGSSIKHVMDLLSRVCDVMSGSIRFDHALLKDSIRPGINAAVAEAASSYFAHVTVLFFPDDKRRSRHMKLYERSGMPQLMPLVTRVQESTLHSAHGCAARLPGHIYVHKGEGIDAAQAKCTSLLESHNEAATIWCQLTRLLVMTHKRGIVLRDLQKRNVVRIQTRAGLQWTLLEFGNVTRPNALAMSVTARTCPPELAPYVQAGQQAEIAFGFDLWQLGMLIFEVHSGEPYWGRASSDAAVFETLLDRSAPLPHEQRPIKPPVIQSVISRLLTRSSEHRLTAQQLEDVLATEVTSEMPNLTINRGERMVVEPARVLAI